MSKTEINKAILDQFQSGRMTDEKDKIHQYMVYS